MSSPYFEHAKGTPSSEVTSELFVNSRGELINAKVELLTDPERGEVWRAWAAQNLPVEVFRAFGMVEVEGSDDWLNVVEHNVFVAAGSLTLGKQLSNRGVSVDFNRLARAAIVHDASKRLDEEMRVSREAEATDKTFESVATEFGYTAEEIADAKNTGRLEDRYLQDPVERMRAIANQSIEANIIGYIDARSRGSRLVALEEAMNDHIASKPNDEAFFTQNWRPYYDSVEAYFRALAPSFDPEELTDDTIFEAIQWPSD